MQIFINTYGTYVHVKDDMFEIKTPDETDKKSPKRINHIAAHKVSSIVMSKGAALSTDAIALALKHNIDIVVVHRDGHPMGRFWHSKLGSTTSIRKRQLETALGEQGLFWVKKWLSQKLENQCDFLQDLKKHRSKLQSEISEKTNKILALKEKIDCIPPQKVSDVADTLRGLEGSAGRHYFDTLTMCIPDKYQFSGRSFRPAADPFNALLNYAYGVLYSRTERALMLAGLDPYVGFMHRDDYNTKSLVFDFIEPYRIYADRYVFRTFSGKQVRNTYFEEFTGGVSLNQEGKAALIPKYLDYLDSEKIRYRGRNQTRMNAMQHEAHQFANQLIAEK